MHEGSETLSLARPTASVGNMVQEKGNANVAWWVSSTLEALGTDEWRKVGLRQLSGMLILVFARTHLMVGFLVITWSRFWLLRAPLSLGGFLVISWSRVLVFASIHVMTGFLVTR
jgi:hypothetical protein